MLAGTQTMLTRRTLLLLTVATVGLAATGMPAFAEADAGAFVQGFGKRLTEVVNGDGSLPEKEKRLRPLIDSSVDVDAVARFCLGRFAANSTPQQVAEFTRLFHAVLINNITSKVGEYRGVSFTVGNSNVRGNETVVSSVVTRPNNAPNNVQWIVNMAGSSPKIVDVVAEGTSLRLTQRSDYASFLSQHGNNVDTLLAAMRAQIASN
jgi:phospholipid transport system substrate-binding protein